MRRMMPRPRRYPDIKVLKLRRDVGVTVSRRDRDVRKKRLETVSRPRLQPWWVYW